MSLESNLESFESGELEKEQYIEQMFEVHQTLFEYSKWLKKTDVKKIVIEEGRVLMETKYKGSSYQGPGPMFFCGDRDFRIAPIEILNFKEYEPNEYSMMLQCISSLGEKPVIFDVGANIGFYSMHLSREFPDASIHSFEPIPKTFEFLSRNFDINQPKNVTTYHFALSDENTEKEFYYYPEGSGNASMSNLSEREGVETYTCQLQRMDSFSEEKNLLPDFVKVDVEGAELLVFKGAAKTLEKAKPIVMTEMLRKWSAKFDYHPNEIIGLFKELGYECFASQGSRLKRFDLMDEDTVETNFFFLHGQKHSPLIKKLSK